MSTNKTQNYNLHSWVPQDEFHVSEINENFTALDAALHQEVGVLDALLQAETAARTQQVATLTGQVSAKAEASVLNALSLLMDQKVQMVTGTYNGGPENQQTITLGFQPKAVLSIRANGFVTSSTCSEFFCTLSIPGYTANGILITETGFIARDQDKAHMNSNYSQFIYIAIF